MRQFMMAVLAGLLLAANPALAADAPREAAGAPATLGEWIARDRAMAALPPGPARDAELASLHRAVVDGLQAALAAEDAKVNAGQVSAACLPPPGTTELTSAEIGTWLQSRPTSEHGEPMQQVLARFLSERFPCP